MVKIYIETDSCENKAENLRKNTIFWSKKKENDQNCMSILIRIVSMIFQQ